MLQDGPTAKAAFCQVSAMDSTGTELGKAPPLGTLWDGRVPSLQLWNHRETYNFPRYLQWDRA
jgi:hypothetical protein